MILSQAHNFIYIYIFYMHSCVVDRFHAGGNFPSVCPFPTFQRLNGKYIPRNMIELFATQLRQIPKCSEECAVSLALRFESIGGLVSFIDSCPSTKAAEVNRTVIFFIYTII